MLKAILKPYNLFLITSIFAFLMWVIPTSNNIYLQGFTRNQSLFSLGGLVAFCYIIGVYSLSFLFFHLGVKLYFKRAKIVLLNNDNHYMILSFLALLGVLFTYYKILAHSSGILWLFFHITNGNGNILKNILYEHYSIGFYSLRYIAILSAAMSFEYFQKKEKILLNIINIILLLLVALISSRLSIVIFVIITLYLNKSFFIKKKSIFILGMIIIILLLVVLNYLRNISYYKSFSISNPFEAFWLQVASYFGTTFQGLISVGNFSEVWSHADIISNKTSLVDIAHYTHIAINYNTNSALLYLVGAYGVFGIVYLIITISFTSFISGIIFNANNHLFKLLYGVILYCYFDLFRLFMFYQGIILTLISTLMLLVFLQRLVIHKKQRTYTSI